MYCEICKATSNNLAVGLALLATRTEWSLVMPEIWVRSQHGAWESSPIIHHWRRENLDKRSGKPLSSGSGGCRSEAYSQLCLWNSVSLALKLFLLLYMSKSEHVC